MILGVRNLKLCCKDTWAPTQGGYEHAKHVGHEGHVSNVSEAQVPISYCDQHFAAIYG